MTLQCGVTDRAKGNTTVHGQPFPRTSGFGAGRAAAARGSVTAELAVVLPAVTFLLGLLLLGAGAGVLQLRLEEAARSAARSLARGEDPVDARLAAANLAGARARVSVDLDGNYARVTVSARVGGPLSALMPWTQSAVATAKVEQTAAPGDAQEEWPGDRPGTEAVQVVRGVTGG